MNVQQALSITKGLNINATQERFACDVLVLHDVLDKVLDRFNQSDFAYKRAQKAKALGQPKGAVEYFRKQDRAANAALLNTLAGATRMAKRLGKTAGSKSIAKDLDGLLTNKKEFAAFQQSMIDAYSSLVIEDDEVSGVDAVWGAKALDYYLALGHKKGIKALFQELAYSLGQFEKYRQNLDKGRATASVAEFKKAAPYLLADDDRRRGSDLVHIWGFRWIIVFKVIVRVVCYIFIICFFWEEESIVKELKKVWVCKWVRPDDFNPSDLG